MGIHGKPLLGSRVLVVEDDAIIALDIMAVLSDAGADIIGPAKTVKRAVELAEEADLDCGILDIRLQDGLVFPAARVLQQKKVNIVFCSGQADPKAIKRDWPAAKVVPKPAPVFTLMQAVAEACRPPSWSIT